MSKSIQRRFIPAGVAPVKLQTRADGGQVITGYGAVFFDPADPGTEYQLWEDAFERILPGAFDRALREADDARGLFNHDPSNLLGRVSSGTMRLSVDKRGLRYEITVDPADPDHQRVMRKIERGDLTGSSFAFIADEQTWEIDSRDGETREIRIIRSVQLMDTGPVTYPAYEASTTGLRAEGDLQEVRQAHAKWKAQEASKALLQVPILPA